MDRRDFLLRTLGASLATAAGCRRGAGVTVGGRLEEVGLQLYPVRRELEADFEGTLARVAALGYREVELAGLHGRTPAAARAALDRAGLRAVAGHVPLEALELGWPRHLDDALVLGHRYVVCGFAPAERFRSVDAVARLADRFDRAGAAARSAGLGFAYHNHDAEFAPVAGEPGYDLLCERTSPTVVELELDLYWTLRAGGDPVRYLERYPDRFPLVHVKDMDRTPRRGFTEVGRGVLDFPRLLAACERAGVRHYLVEQDETPGPALESAAASLAYLRALRW
jgi:sugar phosphate isomerase/epimerase